jgi:two-component system response regulator AtoC
LVEESIRNARMKKARSLLVIDDDISLLNYIKNLFSLKKEYKVITARSGEEAIKLIRKGVNPNVVLLDVLMPGMDGLETLREIKNISSEIPVIMLSGVDQIETIVEAMKSGACDYIKKPFEDDELRIAINKVFEKQELLKEIKDLNEQLKGEAIAFVSISDPMEKIKGVIEQVSDSDVPVLILGESGVGKEVIARYLHLRSPRRDKPFVKVNCAALPKELLESELFGHEKGAFTGAYRQKAGRFELANRGTIFLDEIGEIDLGLQAKLLQVLQDGEFPRVGGEKDIKVDVRVVASTNKDLEDSVEQGTFRKDLYYRLNVVKILVPPLRRRREDIPILCQHFLDKYNRKYGRKIKRISPVLMKVFEQYSWPGNVRELENIIKKLVVFQSENLILEELSQSLSQRSDDREENPLDLYSGTSIPLKEIGRRAALKAEKELIRLTLDRTRWNKAEAARILNISYKGLLNKIKECGLDNP